MVHDHIHQPSGVSKELIGDDLQQRPDVHLKHGRFQRDTQTFQSLLEGLGIFTQNLRVQLIQRGEDEVNKSPRRFGVLSLSGEFAGGRREVDVSPETISKRVHVQGAVRIGIHLSKRVESETPVHIGTREGDIAILRTQPQRRVWVDGARKRGQ